VGINQNISNFYPTSLISSAEYGQAHEYSLQYLFCPPSANDLQPVRQHQPQPHPRRKSDLKPNYQHQLNFNANVWLAMTGRYIWSGGSATLRKMLFGNSTTFDQFGRTISKTVNVDGNMFATVYAGGGYPILNRKLTFEPSLNASYFKTTTSSMDSSIPPAPPH
jgi:hypothetical protein